MINPIKKYKTENKRDILNFITMRFATHKDDLLLGNFLIQVFDEKQKEKIPSYSDSDERLRDLLNVSERRREGVVLIYELGHEIVATFSLIHPQSSINDSWLPNSAMLRCVAVGKDFQGIQITKYILEEVENLSLQYNADYTCLHVFEMAPQVGNVYERNGFIRDKRGDTISNGKSILGFSREVPKESNLMPIYQANLQ